MRWAMSGRMSGGPWYWWINEYQEDDADKTEETEAIHLPNRSRDNFGVGKAVVSVRNRAGASGGNKGLCRLAGGDGNIGTAETDSGRLLAQNADGENIQSDGKGAGGVTGEEMFGGLGGNSPSSCRGPTPHKLASRNAVKAVVSEGTSWRWVTRLPHFL